MSGSVSIILSSKGGRAGYPRRGLPRIPLRARRQLDHDREPVRNAGFGVDPAAVALDDLAHDREPEPRAAIVVRGGAWSARGAIEALEYVRQLVGGQPGPVVADGEREARRAVRPRRPARQRQLDPAAGGHVAQRVREQVLEHLLDAVA